MASSENDKSRFSRTRVNFNFIIDENFENLIKPKRGVFSTKRN